MIRITPRIICHGGAGTLKPSHETRQKAVERATEVGFHVLQGGGTALEAVEEAIVVMEDEPTLNAGTGSWIQMDGMSRMDACIMSSELDLGSVIQISNVKNPIKVARRIMDSGVHCMLMGRLAEDFARNEGIPFYDNRTREKLEIWLDLHSQVKGRSTYEMVHTLKQEIRQRQKEMMGTVGAVAMDVDGLIAAGTSTGGLRIDMPGRVGDSPLPGCGTYANRLGGVSCTGTGEKIMRVALAHEVVSIMEHGIDAQEAVDKARFVIEEIGGLVGIITIDRNGNIGKVYNTEMMESHQIVG